MGVLGNVMSYFTQETSRNKNLSIIAGLLVRVYPQKPFLYLTGIFFTVFRRMVDPN